MADPFQPAKVFNIFEPQFTTIVQYDDNIYTAESESQITSSFIYYFKPSIAFTVEDGANRYGGEYMLTSSFYSDNQGGNDNDDMTDHEFSLFTYNEFTAKHRTNLYLGYDKLHEKRGSGFTDGQPFRFSTPIEYDQKIAHFHYQFGGRNAKMRIGTGVSYYDKEYGSYTPFTRNNDFDKVTFSADSDYQIGDVTFLTLDISSAEVSYKNISSKDNRDKQVLVGLTWRGSSIINGRARIGYQYKTFADDNRDDFHGNTVDLRINWLPRQRDTYSITLRRAAEDYGSIGEQTVDYINNFTGSLAWQHQWTSKFDSNIQIAYTNEDYIGVDREDKTASANAELIYGFSRWLNLAAGWEYLVSSSNQDTYDYDQNILTLTLRAGL
ncbi:MAG: outer membrane beta-barrel protein [Melioribacteraceae bacterium]|nr:outer membrane beta-barrel protein [Melioribacteraceae bacterium]